MVPLLIAGGSEAWFGYRDQRARLNDLLNAEARLAAVKIEDFLDGIRDQLGWTVQLPWSEESGERHRLDALRLLRQVPAVESLTLVDAAGRERLFVSRIGLNRIDERRRPLRRARRCRARAPTASWFGPVRFQDGSEPFMTIAVAGNRSAVGVAVAEVNLKFIWDVISAIQVGRTGDAFVLDRPGTPRRPSGHQPGAARRRSRASDRCRPCAAPSSTGPARRRPAATSQATRCWRRWRRSPASTGASSSSSRWPRPSGRSTPRCGARRRCSSPAPLLAAVLA